MIARSAVRASKDSRRIVDVAFDSEKEGSS